MEVQLKVFNFSIWLRTAPLVGACECTNKQYIANSVLTGEVTASFPPYAVSSHVKSIYTGCPRRNVPNFGRVFLRLKYTDITQNTYIQS